MRKQKNILMLVFVVAICSLTGCSGIARKAVMTTPAKVGYQTSVHKDLLSLPKPKRKIVVAVYKFRDQTGQYKPNPNATTFSTAVTQGATSMLIKALEDSGWFIPVEREGLANLLTERKIIRGTRENHNGKHKKTEHMPDLPPLLYASVALEGGVIAYETNIVTGGLGARYFGIGGSSQIRKDKVTVYLRSVSIKNGSILNTVSTNKTILSREVDFGVYRFISYKRLLEIETGLSTNEPTQMCVLEAIEKAVVGMVIEGIENKAWELENPEDFNSPVIQQYLQERNGVEKAIRFDRDGNVVHGDDAA